MKMFTSVLFAAAGTLALVGCGDDKSDTASSAAPAAAASAASTAIAASVSSTAPAAVGPAAASTVSANNASVAQLTAAFEAAGIPNAARWANEVEEYRPYPADPQWAKLRKELAKYNPAPEVLEKIVATLAP